jgi:hypothetical protein
LPPPVSFPRRARRKAAARDGGTGSSTPRHDAKNEAGTIAARRIMGQPDRRWGDAREASLSLAGALG